MSYINEALKKAQKERDSHYIGYSGLLAASKKKRRSFGGKLFRFSLLVLLVILLVFAAYSWLDRSDSRTQETTEDTNTANIVKTKSTADEKAFYDKAKGFYKNGDLQEAKRLYQEALGVDPGFVDALNDLGVIYIQEKDFTAAKSSLEKAARLKPGHVDPYYNLACLHAIKGESRQGLDYLKKAVSLEHSVRDWARKDSDLENLRALPEFEEITGIKMILNHTNTN